MNERNEAGPTTDPCGTPLSTALDDDVICHRCLDISDVIGNFLRAFM